MQSSRVALVVVSALAVSACARNLVERAIAARGGPLTSLSREVSAEVYQAMPGSWRWQTAYRVPDLYRWTIRTYGEDQHYVYDGKALSCYVGTALVETSPSATSSFRTHARWTALTSLDVLGDRDRVTWSELDAGSLPPGAAHGLTARFRDDGSTYLLWFDADDRLIGGEGDISLPPFGGGRLRASFADFRTVSGFILPSTGHYLLNGRPLFDERVLRAVPNDPRLTAESFERAPAPPYAR
jgi:hypothetical protein